MSSAGIRRRILERHCSCDYLINNASRSIRRGIINSFDRFHDFDASKSALDSFAACAASEFVDKKISTTCRLLAQRIALRDNAQDSVGASGARKRVSEAMG